jgi:hypothetical protein
MVGESHWNGWFKPQYSPVPQPPFTVEQSIWFAAAVPQPSYTIPHSLPEQAAAGVRGTQFPGVGSHVKAVRRPQLSPVGQVPQSWVPEQPSPTWPHSMPAHAVVRGIGWQVVPWQPPLMHA